MFEKLKFLSAEACRPPPPRVTNRGTRRVTGNVAIRKFEAGARAFRHTERWVAARAVRQNVPRGRRAARAKK
jgi:hypothetical protein